VSRILTSDAVCLRSIPTLETSKLVSFFTRDYGKLLLQARGARRPKSKFGAALEILTHSRIIFYRREGRHINTLSDAAIVEDFPVLRGDDQRLRAGAIIAEFTDRNFEPEAPSPVVFRLLLDALRTLNSSPAPRPSPLAVAFSYMFKVTGRLGFAPQLEHCLACRRRKAAAFSPRLGGLLCSHCISKDPNAIRITAPVLHELHLLYSGTFAQVLDSPTPSSQHLFLAVRHQSSEIILQHLRFHLERFDLKSLRSLSHEPKP
jgi:DNA repair protein RecO (recombination protein O)